MNFPAGQFFFVLLFSLVSFFSKVSILDPRKTFFKPVGQICDILVALSLKIKKKIEIPENLVFKPQNYSISLACLKCGTVGNHFSPKRRPQFSNYLQVKSNFIYKFIDLFEKLLYMKQAVISWRAFIEINDRLAPIIQWDPLYIVIDSMQVSSDFDLRADTYHYKKHGKHDENQFETIR